MVSADASTNRSRRTRSSGTAAERAPAGGRRVWRRFSRPDWQYAIAFLGPVVLLAILVRIFPAIMALKDTFFRAIPGSILPPKFVFLDNYVDALARPSFQQMIGRTIFFNVILNPVQVALALALAVLLTQRVRLAGLWRSLIFLPVGIPHVVSAITWGIAMRPEGPLNAMLAVAGIPPQPFLTSTQQAIFCLMLIATWIGTGYWMIFLIAGLQDIPEMYYEAAKIDGSGFWSTFVHVTIPMLRRPLLFVLVANTVANFVIFVIVQILTGGGPQDSTSLIMYDIYRQAYQLSDKSTAAVETVVLLVIMMAFVLLQFRLFREEKD